MNTEKTYKENIQGGEFDWFATDLDGNIAMFSTAGEGSIPKNVIDNYLDYDRITHSFNIPNWGSAAIWSDYAKLGLYVYDWDLPGGPYIKVCDSTQDMNKKVKEKILSLNSLTNLLVNFKEENRLTFEIKNNEFSIKKTKNIKCCEHGSM